MLTNQKLPPNISGELALAASEPFSRCRLQMYHQISICGQNLDYLITKGKTLLLAINLTCKPYAAYAESSPLGIPVVSLPVYDMEQALVQDVVNFLEPLVHRDGPTFAESIDPIPEEYYGKMAQLSMTQQQDGGLLMPTAYGSGIGIIRGYLPPDADGNPCPALFILPSYKADLDKALAWADQIPMCSSKGLSWAQAVLQAKQGLPLDDSYAVSIVQDLASIPLAEYMASYPDELKLLRSRLTLDDSTAYQDAAHKIFQFCTDPARSGVFDQDCIALTYAFATPIIMALGTMPRPLN